MTDDYVYIAVPKKWSTAIYQVLGELAAEAPGVKPVSKPVERDEILVRRMFVEGQEQQRRLMLTMARRPGHWFTTKELARELEYPSGSVLAGVLGAFGRKAKNRYGGRTPWDSKWDSSAEVSRHSMHADVAETILAAAEASD